MSNQFSKEQILQQVNESSSPSVRFAVTDIDGVLRGKIISKEKFSKIIDSGSSFCNVIFGWDMSDKCYTNTKVSGWHTGYPDEDVFVDLESFKTIPWENNQPFILGDFRDSKNLKDICPRSLLESITKEANELGFIPKFSNELEWFNFKETPQSLSEKNYENPTPLTPGMFGYSIIRISQFSDYVNDLFNKLTDFGIPIEGLHTETGNGVYEACIKYSDIEVAADYAALFKTAVKEIAYRHEILPSFMAKWNLNLPGCSGHIHQSLWDFENRNLFYNSENPEKLSNTLKQFIAGQLHCLPYILPMLAPTTNSYKRLSGGDWAPNTVSWGIENRTTALRVINTNETAIRVEHRVPGSDANPYLSMAACLASGLYGINNELDLENEAIFGNAYEEPNSILLPKSLQEATIKMKSSDIPPKLFGNVFTDHFIKTREWEYMAEDKNDTKWELKRYFEIV